MKTKTRKKISLFLAALLGLMSFSACDFLGKDNSSISGSVVDEETFEVLYKGKEAVNLAVGAQTEIPIGKDVGDKNYLRIKIATDLDIVGYIHYATTKIQTKRIRKKFILNVTKRNLQCF